MNVEEFDTALSDLETRVDRLRALYENWFRGYEKMEPGVARKDVERRVYGLRKELPRNTALRFRYHQLYQRYTTLATYWQRTARQIEEGTYRLHLQRLKRRRDDDVARTVAPPAKPNTGDSSAPPRPAFELNLDETLDVRNLLDDFDLDQVANALDGGSPRAEPAPPGKVTATIAAQVRTEAAGRLSVPDAAALGAARASTGQPGAALGDSTSAARASARFARPNAEASPRSVVGNSQRPPPMAPANDVAPVRPIPTASGVRPPAVPTAARGPSTATMPMPPPPPPAATAARPTGTAAYGIPPLPGRLPVPPPPTAKPPTRSAVPSAGPVTPRPAPVTPAVVRPAPDSVALSDQRLRKIYDEYTAARRKNNEGDVRFETLAGSIQKMLPDLHKRHQGKQIDFEVVVKDGRVGLKPRAT
jgi:hypothetical protein